MEAVFRGELIEVIHILEKKKNLKSTIEASTSRKLEKEVQFRGLPWWCSG